MEGYIEISGARVHNLKNINLKIPRNKFIVITEFPDRENLPLPLIRFMPKVSDVMLKAFPHMPGSFWVV